jgi:GT2 family glycosyltransferase
MLDLSIVLPTCDRAPLLERAIAAIEETTRRSHEIVVVDGASTDETPDVLRRAQSTLGDRLRVIREDRREGFVKAANKGLRAARGRNLLWINDDARPLPDAFDRAVAQLDGEPADVAFVALFHRWATMKNIAYETIHARTRYRLCHVRGTLYANFPVGRRQTFERLEYLDERFYFYAADPDLSLKAWDAGMRIVPAYGAMLNHDVHEDARREADGEIARRDNAKLFAKWDLPAKNPWRNDFDPANPCTLRGLAAATVARPLAA